MSDDAPQSKMDKLKQCVINANKGAKTNSEVTILILEENQKLQAENKQLKIRIKELELENEVVFGEYTIHTSLMNPDKWYRIQHISGEGGDFPKKDVNAVIEKYYKENF